MTRAILAVCLVAVTILVMGCSGERSDSTSSSSTALTGAPEESKAGLSRDGAGPDVSAAGRSGASDSSSSGVSGTGEGADDLPEGAAVAVSGQTTDMTGAPGSDGPLSLEMTPTEEEAAERSDTPAEETRQTSPSGLSVIRAYICKGIEQSEPTEAGRSFLPEGDGVGRLCCFSEIGGAAGPDSIFHVWYWGDRDMGRIPLEVKSRRWRTWSKKKVLDEWRGEWHVDIVDRDGFLLERLYFSIE